MLIYILNHSQSNAKFQLVRWREAEQRMEAVVKFFFSKFEVSDLQDDRRRRMKVLT